MSTEILSCICEDFSDDEKLIAIILYYLYNISNDEIMKEQIINIMNEMNYCIECGNKMNEIYECESCDLK